MLSAARQQAAAPKAGFKIAHPNCAFVPIELENPMPPVSTPTSGTGKHCIAFFLTASLDVKRLGIAIAALLLVVTERGLPENDQALHSVLDDEAEGPYPAKFLELLKQMISDTPPMAEAAHMRLRSMYVSAFALFVDQFAGRVVGW